MVSAASYVLVEHMANGFRDRRWFIRSVLAIWVISSIFAAFLLYQLNGVVHGTLYNYGLQFSNSWAVQYWSLERLLYVCLFVPSLLGGFALVFDLWRNHLEKVPVVRRTESTVATGRVSPVVQTAAKDNSMMISCPKCKRIFGKPLNMLDFSSGKTQLINVCPYCNHVLGDSGKVDTNIRVFQPDEEEEVHERK